jgi:hypothetical protein
VVLRDFKGRWRAVLFTTVTDCSAIHLLPVGAPWALEESVPFDGNGSGSLATNAQTDSYKSGGSQCTGLLRQLTKPDQPHVLYAHDGFVVVVVSDVAESTCHTLLSAYVACEGVDKILQMGNVDPVFW